MFIQQHCMEGLHCDLSSTSLLIKSKEELKVNTLLAVVGEEMFELMIDLCNPDKPEEITYEAFFRLVKIIFTRAVQKSRKIQIKITQARARRIFSAIFSCT
ncbi:unnamed protein product [Acanthoscelides obtectus]|uniref:Uncharacterized protein n=1 Tax=Acanthoscelides obtectus TaxID=200917 RepID=A0A9P0Q826_ACAOB|nr:unnamed protein product [Acanthoscelides obtectus]CAK1646893.1 hypothetical protein AOBTE_LOCUS14923 [Acanthoscelides obtectus]